MYSCGPLTAILDHDLNDGPRSHGPFLLRLDRLTAFMATFLRLGRLSISTLLGTDHALKLDHFTVMMDIFPRVADRILRLTDSLTTDHLAA